MGTTHISLTLANYICSKLGMTTAYIELNPHNHICALVRKKRKPSFCYKGIVFYPNTHVTSLPEILRKDYRYFILDMGVLNTYTASEFLRCDKSFLICSPSKWRKSQLEKKIENLFKHQTKKNCITLIMNLSYEESYFSISSDFGKRLSFPYIENPFQIEPRHFRAISLLLK